MFERTEDIKKSPDKGMAGTWELPEVSEYKEPENL